MTIQREISNALGRGGCPNCNQRKGIRHQVDDDGGGITWCELCGWDIEFDPQTSEDTGNDSTNRN